ncbi:ankyrin protein [Fusarium sp. NRRL 25303]|nr:ankyrin protein [Fusarium sp. NRRL 25303]
MERRRLSHSDDGALPYHAKRRKTGFHQDEEEAIHDRYKVAWICALHIEMAAARAMLDEEHADCPRQANDTNSYVLGSIQNHNVVIACLPAAQYGTNNAASVLSHMRRTFPGLEIGLMVGIGGGVPLKADIRLGDIVVGVRVMQYDLGKTRKEGFQRTADPKIPDSSIRTVISNLRSRHELNGSRVPSILVEKMGNHAAYSRPSEPDRLFLASYYHHGDPDLPCDECDLSKLETRKIRLSTDPAIYYGGIASANTVMKDSTVRDEIARELDVLCFEMEAAGLMDIMPCLPIRGICDYSDSHKSKEWQRYAAATAAAYAYEFLELWRGDSQAPYVSHHQPYSEHNMGSERHKNILESLNFEEIDVRKSIIKAAHSKTCRWFLKHPDYLSWIDPLQTSEHHGFLWIRGKPGAGKSTIMKFIYLESKKKDRKHQSLTASFFFNARGEVLEKTVSGMYRSLLLQLFHGFSDLESVLDDPDLLPRNQSGCPPLNVLKDLLRAAVAKLGQRSFRCFIDALDECDEQQVMDLVEYFEDLAEQCTEDSIDLRVCFSSRHYPYIDIKYGIRVILEDQTGHASDLESYIKSNLRIKDRPLLAELQEKMLEKAAGVFLWVVLVVDIMNKENCRGRLAMRRRLEQVPSGLGDLFKDLLKRDNSNMEELQLSLLWILLSARPLKPDEYYHAIWSGLYLEGLADLEIPEVDMEDSEDCFDRCIISSSKGLAEITKVKQPRVQFIHESVRDFLIKDKGLHELWPELGPDWESLGHDRLKMCCYSYFEFYIEKEQLGAEHWNLLNFKGTKDTKAYPFLQYASHFVLHHSDFAANTANQQTFLESFRTFDWKVVFNTFEKFLIRRYKPRAELLYVLADRGHSLLIQSILKKDANIYIPSEEDRYVYPLISAMAKGDKASVLALLRLPSALYKGVDITEGLLPNIDASGSSRTPLSWACENGHFGIAKVLVERDAQPVDTVEAAYSPLMLASKNGHIDVARWLVDHGADIHKKYKKESAIWLASSNGYAELVELLLDAGADLNTCGVNDAPILCPAAERGHEKVVKLLLKRKADVEAQDNRGKTPLHLTAQKEGSEAIIKALLSYGADIEARDDNDRTPLHLAAQKEGSQAIIEALLSYRADIEARDDNGRTPLVLAVIKASINEIGFLIRQGADLTAQEKDGETCLHAAMRRYIPSLDIVRLLLENGAKADARTERGQTCLHTLAHQGEITTYTSDIIQLITSRGIDINDNDNHGNTPLHLVTQHWSLEALSIFADQPGVDFNARNHTGKTPLHAAASLPVERTEELDILMRKGADINSRDDEGRTPLDYAIGRGYEPRIQLLIENGGTRGVT